MTLAEYQSVFILERNKKIYKYIKFVYIRIILKYLTIKKIRLS
jgi:aspartyl/asparaginyl beta-hydroxylase (cupin superfamily)